MEYARHFPERWLDEDGMPRTWWHFVHGLAHVGRTNAQRTLQQHTAMLMANAADPRVRERWRAAQTIVAGWRRD